MFAAGLHKIDQIILALLVIAGVLATVSIVDGGPCVGFGNSTQRLTIPLHEDYYRSLAGRAVTFGIRPEDISIERSGSNDVRLDARVVVVEPLGAETLVTLACEGGELIARLAPNVPFAPDQQTGVWINMDKFHLFDAASGGALRAET